MKNDNTNAFIGAKIKAARETAKLSQADLAKSLGYGSATAISLIESGERKVKVEDLKRVSEVLNRDIKYFIGQEEPRTDVKIALRADKDLTTKDKETILHFIDLAKNRHGRGGHKT